VRKTNKAHNAKLLLALTDDLLFEFKSIEDDILNLVDEVDLHEFLKEASEAIEDAEKLSEFIREKVTIAIERFLVSLLKRIYVWILVVRTLCLPSNSINHRTIYRKCPYRLKNVILLMDGF
jgi:hypothetical protein